MTTGPGWLPSLVLLPQYGGDWNKYVEAVYGYFHADFVYSNPEFRGVPVGIKREPTEQSKEATFWHLVSEGGTEEERVPDLRRCERIRWPCPIIEHADDPPIKVWLNKRRGDTRICIWFAEVEYLVVLAQRKGYVLLWTAYPVARSHRKRKLQREYEAYLKANAAP